MAKRVTGTRAVWPDPQVFVRDSEFTFEALTERARQTAYLVPGLMIRIGREPGGRGPGEAEFCFDGGISEFCAHLGSGEPVTEVLRLQGRAGSPRPCRCSTSRVT